MMKKNVYLIPFFLLLACSAPKEEKEDTKAADRESTVTSTDEEKKVVLFFGNSITAGYQLDIEAAFPALLQKRFDIQVK